MAKATLDDVRLVIARMMTVEQDEHASLLRQIDNRNPANKPHIVENLSVVHKTRMEVLESLLEIVKNMKSGK